MPFAIQRVQTDRGTEFFAEEVQRRLTAETIKFRPIPPRSPHLNGKVERAQRTVLEEFWATVSRMAATSGPRRRASPPSGCLTLQVATEGRIRRSRNAARLAGLGAEPGVGGDFGWLAAGIDFDGIHQGHQRILVAGIVAQAMRENDLVAGVDGKLGVVALDEAIPAQPDAALGIGEVALRRGLGRARGMFRLVAAAMAARLSGARLGVRFSIGLCLGLQFGVGGADAGEPLLLVVHPVGRLVATPVRAEFGILCRVGGFRPVEPGRHLDSQRVLSLAHAGVAHRRVLRCVRLRAESHQFGS